MVTLKWGRIPNYILKVKTKPIGFTDSQTIARCENVMEFRKAILCIMDAALTMHANGYVHRDIRWPNRLAGFAF